MHLCDSFYCPFGVQSSYLNAVQKQVGVYFMVVPVRNLCFLFTRCTFL